jgi:hypothetical protein
MYTSLIVLFVVPTGAERASANYWDHSVLLPDQFESLHGATWRAEHAVVSEPLIEPKFDWDADVHSHGTVLRDPTANNTYKMWYVSTPAGCLGDSSCRVICYATSQDGEHWERPMLDIYSWKTSPTSNIVLMLGKPGDSRQPPSQYASVFVDAKAPPLKRYEMFVLLAATPTGPVAGACANSTAGPGRGVYRFYSADGTAWNCAEDVSTHFPGRHGDGNYFYREGDYAAGYSYTSYVKQALPAPPGGLAPFDIGAGEQRIIMRTRSADGTDWGPLEMVGAADWRDAAGDQFVELTGTRRQGGGLIGHYSVFHGMQQHIDVHWAGSRDGLSWWRPARRSAVPLGMVCGLQRLPLPTACPLSAVLMI